MRRYPELSAAAIALGTGLVLLAELAQWQWTKLFGAVLVTAGGVGLGTRVGLAGPLRWSWIAVLRGWRVQLGLLAATLFVLPLLAAMLAGLAAGIRAFAGPAGLFALLLLLLATLLCLWLGLRAILHAPRAGPREPVQAAKETV